MIKSKSLKILIVSFSVSFFIPFIFADKITVYNKGEELPIFVATYYQGKDKTYERKYGPYKIEAKKDLEVERPGNKRGKDRRLIFSFSEKKLKELLTKDDFEGLPDPLPIGKKLQGSTFYVELSKRDLKLKGYNKVKWTAHQAGKIILTGVEKAKEVILNSIRKGVVAESDPICKKVATVRIGTTLSSEEQDYLEKRDPLVKKALEKMLGKNFDGKHIPRIAFCGSGGGYRAMVCSIGSLLGAEKTGLLDASTYFAGLSGSTWFIGPWLTHGGSLEDYIKQLIPKMNIDLKNTKMDPNRVSGNLLRKLVFDKTVSFVDIYGTLLSNKLYRGLSLGKAEGTESQKAQKMQLSSLGERVQTGNWLFPISTAIMPTGEVYEWFEFTPFEIGSTYLNAFVPTWAFNRKFINGTSIKAYSIFPPEESYGYLLGIFGSAFAARFTEILDGMKEGSSDSSDSSPNYVKLLSNFLDITKLGEKRISAKVFNYTFGMESSPIEYSRLIELVDAGLDFNLPFPPLLRPERKVDIIIALDASATIEGAPALKNFEKYAKRKGIKIPPINYEGLTTRTMTVFKDPSDPSVPVILYLPRIKNDKYDPKFDPEKIIKDKNYGGYRGFLNTFNFLYSEKDGDVEKIIGLTEFNLKENEKAIIAEIEDVIKRKSK